MRSTPLLIEAQPLDGHSVHARFEDGATADVDLSYLLDYGGVFEPLRDPAYFARLHADAEAGTIIWPNGADIAPETLYAHAQRGAAGYAAGEQNSHATNRARPPMPPPGVEPGSTA